MSLVSVIIPIHNAGRYLDLCLESVRQQTHHDLHIVCVDDGSNDQSAAVLQQHCDADSRLQIISQSNAGPGSARNAGLAQAVGDYIMFVDADDLVPPEAVERHLNALRSSPSDFSTGRVVRIAGTFRWPSAMHENGLTRPASATHIFKDPALLFDTTSWNKLFRRDYWTAHRYVYPAHVVFEDVALMTEAHCRASSVDVLGDVVYWWRRRDDGTMSITMRRDDPNLLRDRVGSLQRVRRLLREVAPAPVRRAAETKFLRHDLGSYFRELEDTPLTFQHDFVRLVREFIDESPTNIIDRLPPHLRIAYQLVHLGKPSELVEFLAFLRENEWRLPVQRRGLSLRTDLGPVAKTVPRKFSSAVRRLPLKMGVDRLSWQRETLVIEGYGFIDGVAFNHPAAAVRRLQLVDPHNAVERHVWIAAKRLPPVSPRVRMAPSYEWSGFRAEIPCTMLDPGPAHDSARWHVNLQVLAVGAVSGSALGPPDNSCFAEIRRGRSGLVVRIDWAAGKRLVIEATRPPYTLYGVRRDGDLVCLVLRPSRSVGPRALAVRLTSTTGTMVEAPLIPTASTADGAAEVLVDPVRIRAAGGVGRHVAFQLSVVTSDGEAAVSSELSSAVDLHLAAESVVVVDDGRGGAEIVLSGQGYAITAVSWLGDRLRVTGSCSDADHDLPQLAWCNDAGDMIHGSPRRTTCGFEVTFDLSKIPGPDGVHPIPSGDWTLLGQVEGSWEAAVASHGGALSSDRSPMEGVARIRIGLSSRLRLVMCVEALSAPERSALGQERLQRGLYRRALRSPVENAILLECWGGKSYSDNPRALAEVAFPACSDAAVVVAIADRSVSTPPGVRAVLRGSRDHYELRARARLIITNDTMPKHYVKRPGQRYLQTWHGTPLKRIGLDIERIRFRNGNYAQELRSESVNWDWLISQNAYSSEIFRRAFAYDGLIIETGYPRNDLLASRDDARRAARRDQVRRWLNIDPDQSVILWAPTWRDDTYAPGGGYGASMLVDPGVMDALLPADMVVLFHGHHLFGSVQAHLGHGGRLRNVSGYPDVRDLILASDALVTDYSSIMFDYALTGRPIVFFVPDLMHYERIRGLYLDLQTVAPGPVVSTVDGLADALRCLSSLQADFEPALSAFRRRFCALDDGSAAERVWATVSQ